MDVKKSVVLFENLLLSGQGVIVAPRLIMTALHGKVEVGMAFDIFGFQEEENSEEEKFADEAISSTPALRRMGTGTVFKIYFEEKKFDIALIQLSEDSPPFEHCLAVAREAVGLQQPISVLSCRKGTNGGYGLSAQQSTIVMFDPRSALGRAQYFASDGMSGCGVITTPLRDGSFAVIGVHVAAHDDTDPSPPIKKTKGGGGSVSDNSSSRDRQIHGHTSYCLFCLAYLVPDILEDISAAL